MATKSRTRRTIRTRIGRGGRLVIPAELCRDLGLTSGASVLIAETDDGDLLVSTPAGGLRRAQDLVKRYVQPDVSMVDELLAERRAEVARE